MLAMAVKRDQLLLTQRLKVDHQQIVLLQEFIL